MKEQLIEDIKSFLEEDGLKYLQDAKDKDAFYIAWGSCLGGNVGMQVRNFLRSKYPDIDKEFKGTADFEDYSTELMLEILNNGNN